MIIAMTSAQTTKRPVRCKRQLVWVPLPPKQLQLRSLPVCHTGPGVEQPQAPALTAVLAALVARGRLPHGASLTGSGGPLSPRSTQLYRDIARHKQAERILALTRRLPRELGIENGAIEF